MLNRRDFIRAGAGTAGLAILGTRSNEILVDLKVDFFLNRDPIVVKGSLEAFPDRNAFRMRITEDDGREFCRIEFGLEFIRNQRTGSASIVMVEGRDRQRIPIAVGLKRTTGHLVLGFKDPKSGTVPVWIELRDIRTALQRGNA